MLFRSTVLLKEHGPEAIETLLVPALRASARTRSFTHRVTSRIRKRAILGPYSRPCGGPRGGRRFLMSEVPSVALMFPTTTTERPRAVWRCKCSRMRGTVDERSGDTIPCRMTGVTLHSHVRYTCFGRPSGALPPEVGCFGRETICGNHRALGIVLL